jgi:hypothetical protein
VPHRGRQPRPERGHSRDLRKDDLLKLERRSERAFVLPDEEVWQSFDVPSPPPPHERAARPDESILHGCDPQPAPEQR